MFGKIANIEYVQFLLVNSPNPSHLAPNFQAADVSTRYVDTGTFLIQLMAPVVLLVTEKGAIIKRAQ